MHLYLLLFVSFTTGAAISIMVNELLTATGSPLDIVLSILQNMWRAAGAGAVFTVTMAIVFKTTSWSAAIGESCRPRPRRGDSASNTIPPQAHLCTTDAARNRRDRRPRRVTIAAGNRAGQQLTGTLPSPTFIPFPAICAMPSPLNPDGSRPSPGIVSQLVTNQH